MVGLLLVAAAGCGGQHPVVVTTALPEAHARLSAINAAYEGFDDQHGRSPHNEQELRTMLVSQGQDPDKVLRSPRDGEPFVICYGADVFGSLDWAGDALPVFAYERRGDGGRWVLAPPGFVKELSEEEFRAARFPPGHKVE
jgi:hypothetical protein